VAGGGVGGEFVVAAAEVLDEGVPGGQDPGGPAALQAAHRPTGRGASASTADQAVGGRDLNVNPEIHPDRPSVVAAERHVIRSEGPLRNVQHNRGALADPEPAGNWSAEDVLTVEMLVIAGDCLLYKVTEAGVARYREWTADRDEFREWRLTHGHDEQGAVSDDEQLQHLHDANCPVRHCW
jgi:hypothetical protein